MYVGGRSVRGHLPRTSETGETMLRNGRDVRSEKLFWLFGKGAPEHLGMPTRTFVTFEVVQSWCDIYNLYTNSTLYV